MTRPLAALTALAAVGFGLGWAFLPGPADPTDRLTLAPKAAPAARRFALTAADAKAPDRERPALAVDARGRAALAWSSLTGPNEYTLFVARSADGGATFGEPAAVRRFAPNRFESVMRGKKHTMTSPVLPRLAAAGDVLTLAWAEPRGGRLDLLVATTADGGATFSDPKPAHGPDAGRPCFTALALDGRGRAAVAWMESRNGRQQPFAAALPSAETLVYPGPDGQGVCPCCDLDAAWTPGGGLLVAFRNSKAGHRDVYVARSDDGGATFAEPAPVADWHWAFDGCPHDGPALAVTPGAVHAAWMDGHEGQRRVYHARLGGAAKPLTATGAGEQGHPRLAAGAGRLLAAWDEGSAGGRAVYLASSRDDGATFGPPSAVDARAGAFQTRPEVVAMPGGGAVVAWAELGADGKAVAVARVGP